MVQKELTKLSESNLQLNDDERGDYFSIQKKDELKKVELLKI